MEILLSAIQYGFIFLLTKANEKNYTMNCQFMSFSFLFRHTIEIILKANLAKYGLPIPITHSIKDLAAPLQIYLPANFLPNLSQLDCEGQGDCFKYLTSHEDIPFFMVKEFKCY